MTPLDPPQQGFVARCAGELFQAACAWSFPGRRLRTLDAVSAFSTRISASTPRPIDVPCLYTGTGIFVPQGFGAKLIGQTDGVAVNSYPNLVFTIRRSRDRVLIWDQIPQGLSLNVSFNAFEGGPFFYPNEGYIFNWSCNSAVSRQFTAVVMGIEYF